MAFDFLGQFTESQYNGFKEFVSGYIEPLTSGSTITNNELQIKNLQGELTKFVELKDRLVSQINKINEEYLTFSPSGLPSSVPDAPTPLNQETKIPKMYDDADISQAMWRVKEPFVPTIKALFESYEYQLKRAYYVIDQINKKITLRQNIIYINDDNAGNAVETFKVIDTLFDNPSYPSLTKDTSAALPDPLAGKINE